jgi:hypothetical protein
MLERRLRYTLGILWLEAGEFNQAAPGFRRSSLYSKTYSFGHTAGGRENRTPSPRVEFPENEAGKLLKIKETALKKAL